MLCQPWETTSAACVATATCRAWVHACMTMYSDNDLHQLLFCCTCQRAATRSAPDPSWHPTTDFDLYAEIMSAQIRGRVADMAALLDLNDEEIAPVLRRSLRFLVQSSRCWQTNFDTLTSQLGLDRVQARDALRASPALMALPPKQLYAKCTVLGRLLSAAPEWRAQLDSSGPSGVHRVVGFERKELEHLSFLLESGRVAQQKLLAHPISDRAAFEAKFPGFKKWAAKRDLGRGAAARASGRVAVAGRRSWQASMGAGRSRETDVQARASSESSRQHATQPRMKPQPVASRSGEECASNDSGDVASRPVRASLPRATSLVAIGEFGVAGLQSGDWEGTALASVDASGVMSTPVGDLWPAPRVGLH